MDVKNDVKMNNNQSTDPVDRQRAAALWKWPRLTGRSTGREIYSLYPGHGQSAGRPLAQRPEIWPLAGGLGGRPIAFHAVVLSPTASFWNLYKGGYFGLFSKRFQESFWASLTYLFQWFFSTSFRANTSIQKESLSRVFKSDFLVFFTTNSILVFLTNTWAIHWYIHSIGELLW